MRAGRRPTDKTENKTTTNKEQQTNEEKKKDYVRKLMKDWVARQARGKAC